MTDTNKKTLSQPARVERYLRGTGRRLTVAEAQSQLKISSFSSVVNRLRKAGLSVIREDGGQYRISSRDRLGGRSYVFK